MVLIMLHSQEAHISIILQKKECEALMSTFGKEVGNDKFLVQVSSRRVFELVKFFSEVVQVSPFIVWQTLEISPTVYSSLKKKKPKELASQMSELWKNAPKKMVSNKKLRCVFEQTDNTADHGAFLVANIVQCVMKNK